MEEGLKKTVRDTEIGERRTHRREGEAVKQHV